MAESKDPERGMKTKSSPVSGERQESAAPVDKRALAEQYLPLVRSIAGKIKKTVSASIEFDDLVDYGMIGLLEAAERYDATLGNSFMTFAYYRIRGAIYDGLRGMGWLRRSDYAKLRFEASANEYLAELSGGGSSGHDGSDGSFEGALKDLEHAVRGLAVIYVTTVDGAEGFQIKDTAPLAEERLGLEQARALVRETIKKLAEQEQQLMEMYYYKEMSLEEAGEKLGLSKSWTSRLHARAIAKLQKMLEKSMA